MHDPTNYRPISLLPRLFQGFEKALHQRVNSFLGEHKIFFKDQNGFREKKLNIGCPAECDWEVEKIFQIEFELCYCYLRIVKGS